MDPRLHGHHSARIRLQRRLDRDPPRELRLCHQQRDLGREHLRPEPAGLYVPELSAGFLQRGQGLHLAMGQPHRIDPSLHAAGQGTLRRWDAVYATLIQRSRDAAETDTLAEQMRLEFSPAEVVRLAGPGLPGSPWRNRARKTPEKYKHWVVGGALHGR